MAQKTKEKFFLGYFVDRFLTAEMATETAAMFTQLVKESIAITPLDHILTRAS